MSEHRAIRNPPGLTFERSGLLTDDLMLTATAANGEQLSIVASRERWVEALNPYGSPQPSRSETVRGMYERGEVEIEVYEAALSSEARS